VPYRRILEVARTKPACRKLVSASCNCYARELEETLSRPIDGPVCHKSIFSERKWVASPPKEKSSKNSST
ncbi:hypothetical protein HAX54_039374, partial [Datura stramonium]|nr:hypothetical protein [Datura stramonium]